MKRLFAFACITPVVLFVVVMVEEPEQSATPTVRVIYAIPSDREVSPGAPEAIAAAVTDVQQWYAEQMGGPTFELVDEIPRICRMPHDSDHFDDVDWHVRAVRAVEGRCLTGQPTVRHILVLYVDVPPVCDRYIPVSSGKVVRYNRNALGGRGFAFFNRAHLMGLVEPEQVHICDGVRVIPDGTLDEWRGVLAHELGHALGLLHQDNCLDRSNCLDDSVIGKGAYSYPDTYVHDSDRSFLLRSWQAGSVPNGNIQW